jgi:hypothetical protein
MRDDDGGSGAGEVAERPRQRRLLLHLLSLLPTMYATTLAQ